MRRNVLFIFLAVFAGLGIRVVKRCCCGTFLVGECGIWPFALCNESGVGLIGGLIGLIGDDSVFDGVVLVECVVLGDGDWLKNVEISWNVGVCVVCCLICWFWLFGFRFPFDDE